MTPISCKLIIGLLLTCLLSGCGSDMRPTGGSVSVDGVPVKQGKVTFYPAGGGRSGSGAIDEDGNYVISYKKLGDGLPPGEYVVTIVADELIEKKTNPVKNDPIVGDEGDFSGTAAAQSSLKHIVPTKYNRQETSPLKMTVTNETNQNFPFDISGNK